MAEFVDAEARDAAKRRGITPADIDHCLANPTGSYQHRRASVFTSTLPNGKHIKVMVEDGKVIRTFFHV